MPEELASIRASSIQNSDQDQDPQALGNRTSRSHLCATSSFSTIDRIQANGTCRLNPRSVKSFPHPNLDLIKMFKHVYTEILILLAKGNPRAPWVSASPPRLPTLGDLGVREWSAGQSSLHLGKCVHGWCPAVRFRLAGWQTRRTAADIETISKRSPRAGRTGAPVGPAPAHCQPPRVQRRMSRGAARGLRGAGPLSAPAQDGPRRRRRRRGGVVGWQSQGSRAAPRAHARTYARTPRGSAEFRAPGVGTELGEGRRSPCQLGRRGVREVLRWPQRDGATAPTLGQTPPATGRGSPWPFGAAPGGDA